MESVQSPPQARTELRLLQHMLRLHPDDSPEPRFHDLVFVCIDCEAFEHAHDKITEVGVAVLDTKDLSGLSPGEDEKAWLTKIKHAHYRPVQYARLHNRNFVKGCEDGFKFGTTHWVNIGDLHKILSRIFFDPSRLEDASNFEVDVTGQKRNVVFVAHGARNDKDFMDRIGFSLSAQSNVIHSMDTQVLAGSTKKSRVALQRLLLSLKLEPTNLHNGGNDAAYTLQALVIMAFKDYQKPGSVFADLQTLVGKLPPIVHTAHKAPHVYAGTAEDIALEPRRKRQSTHGPNCDKMQDRKRRKRASRAAELSEEHRSKSS